MSPLLYALLGTCHEASVGVQRQYSIVDSVVETSLETRPIESSHDAHGGSSEHDRSSRRLWKRDRDALESVHETQIDPVGSQASVGTGGLVALLAGERLAHSDRNEREFRWVLRACRRRVYEALECTNYSVLGSLRRPATETRLNSRDRTQVGDWNRTVVPSRERNANRYCRRVAGERLAHYGVSEADRTAGAASAPARRYTHTNHATSGSAHRYQRYLKDTSKVLQRYFKDTSKINRPRRRYRCSWGSCCARRHPTTGFALFVFDTRVFRVRVFTQSLRCGHDQSSEKPT